LHLGHEQFTRTGGFQLIPLWFESSNNLLDFLNGIGLQLLARVSNLGSNGLDCLGDILSDILLEL
jgi:hypothetical protein